MSSAESCLAFADLSSSVIHTHQHKMEVLKAKAHKGIHSHAGMHGANPFKNQSVSHKTNNTTRMLKDTILTQKYALHNPLTNRALNTVTCNECIFSLVDNPFFNNRECMGDYTVNPKACKNIPMLKNRHGKINIVFNLDLLVEYFHSRLTSYSQQIT